MIDNRIEKIAKLVDKKIVAEVGCDHAFITKKLFELNKIDFCFLSDISGKCLEKAKKNLDGFKDKTTFTVADGLLGFLPQGQNLDKKDTNFVPEQAIIAGMGGKEIVKIIKQDNLKQIKYFVLQPQKNVDEVRLFLTKNYFCIKREVVAKQGKMFYNILSVERSDKIHRLSKSQIVVGKFLKKDMDNDFKDYIKFNIQKFGSILEKKEIKSVRDKLDLFKEKGDKQDVWKYFTISKIK